MGAGENEGLPLGSEEGLPVIGFIVGDDEDLVVGIADGRRVGTADGGPLGVVVVLTAASLLGKLEMNSLENLPQNSSS